MQILRNHLTGDGQRIPAAVAVALANPMEDFTEHMGQQGQCGFLTFLVKEDIRILYRGLQFGEPCLGQVVSLGKIRHVLHPWGGAGNGGDMEDGCGVGGFLGHCLGLIDVRSPRHAV